MAKIYLICPEIDTQQLRLALQKSGLEVTTIVPLEEKIPNLQNLVEIMGRETMPFEKFSVPKQQYLPRLKVKPIDKIYCNPTRKKQYKHR